MYNINSNFTLRILAELTETAAFNNEKYFYEQTSFFNTYFKAKLNFLQVYAVKYS